MEDCCNCCENTAKCKPCAGCDCCCCCCDKYEQGQKCDCSAPCEKPKS